MRLLTAKVPVGLALMLMGPVVLPTSSQRPISVFHVVQLTGLSGVKNQSKGSLTVERKVFKLRVRT